MEKEKEKERELQFKRNVRDIKKKLRRRNTLLITNRQVGKSSALLELLYENKSSYLLTFNHSNKKFLINKYKVLFPHDDGWSRIVIDGDTKDMNNTYIDEYFFHETYYKKFLGAVSTMKFPVIVKKYKNKNINNEEMKLILGDDAYSLEIDLRFK